MRDVERRAAVHAALADQTRLRVVDLLAVGDAGSSELSARLAVPSNLLAHHLGILEAAGLIRRHRSEGDGRRSYWRLVPDALEAVGGPAGRPALPPPERVLFVCTANSARSHLAAALWRGSSSVPAGSAGTRPAPRIDSGAVAAARRHRLDLPVVAPQHLRDVAPSVGEGDLVITVCDLAHEELGASSRVHWSIPDPVPEGSAAAFDRALVELAARIRLLAPLVEQAS